MRNLLRRVNAVVASVRNSGRWGSLVPMRNSFDASGWLPMRNRFAGWEMADCVNVG